MLNGNNRKFGLVVSFFKHLSILAIVKYIKFRLTHLEISLQFSWSKFSCYKELEALLHSQGISFTQIPISSFQNIARSTVPRQWNDWKVESKNSSESSFFLKCWKDIFLSSLIFFPFLFFFSGWAPPLDVAEGCSNWSK